MDRRLEPMFFTHVEPMLNPFFLSERCGFGLEEKEAKTRGTAESAEEPVPQTIRRRPSTTLLRVSPKPSSTGFQVHAFVGPGLFPFWNPDC